MTDVFTERGEEEIRIEMHTEGGPREDRGVTTAKERGSGEISSAITVPSTFQPPDGEK